MKLLYAEWQLSSIVKPKALLTGLLVLFIFCSSKAQTNIVPNGSFEIIDSCNYSGGTITAATPWNNLFLNGGADLFSSCNINGITAPYSVFNYQVARSGNNYINACTYWPPSSGFSVKEYANCPLQSNLQNGKSYCITFYVVLINYAKYATDDISLYLDDGSISQTCWQCLVNVTPQITSTSGLILKDTLNWTKVQGIYTANGTENHLTIGSFKDNSLVNYIVLDTIHPSGDAEYLIDDVSVIESSTKIHLNDTTLNKGDTITLGKSIEGMPVDWYDLQGNLLAASSTINISPATSTSYVVKMDLCGNVTYDTVVVSVSTGVEQLTNNKEQLMIYPNPVKQSLVISHQSPELNREVNTIEITDVLGKVCSIPPFIPNVREGLGGFELDISNLTSGIYFIKTTDTNGNTKVGKFVKE